MSLILFGTKIIETLASLTSRKLIITLVSLPFTGYGSAIPSVPECHCNWSISEMERIKLQLIDSDIEDYKADHLGGGKFVQTYRMNDKFVEGQYALKKLTFPAKVEQCIRFATQNNQGALARFLKYELVEVVANYFQQLEHFLGMLNQQAKFDIFVPPLVKIDDFHAIQPILFGYEKKELDDSLVNVAEENYNTEFKKLERYFQKSFPNSDWIVDDNSNNAIYTKQGQIVGIFDPLYLGAAYELLAEIKTLRGRF